MRIAVDAMGGDSAPEAQVEGAIRCAPYLDGDEVVLVGDESRIRGLAAAHGGLPKGVTVCHASQVVGMGDAPVEAVRHKRDSSIARCMALAASGEVSAVVSAGNTGAVVALAMLRLGLLEGIRRPGIAVGLPTRVGKPTLVIDCGANVKCTPENLLHFGLMAAAFATAVLGTKDPKVGVLNIGAETSKGNPLVQQAHALFASAPLNYIGFVEGRDIFHLDVDVVVCDGFVGNVLLKVSEGIADAILGLMSEAIRRTLRRRIGAMLCKYAMLELAAKMDSSEFGGAPLLGVDGTCMICHGRSDSRAIVNAIRKAAEAATYHVNEHIVASLKACGTP